MLGAKAYPVNSPLGEGKDMVPETPPLAKSCWTGTHVKIISALAQINSSQLSFFVSESASIVDGGVGARGGAEWRCVDFELC